MPQDTAQAVVDFHPEGRNFGGEVVGNYVGSVFDNVSSGFGPTQHGHYAVVDLNAYVTFGPGDRQRLNAQPRERLRRGLRHPRQPGARATPTARPTSPTTAACPRTLHVTYSYSF